MSEWRLLDTNLIVRHLVQDHPAHAKVAGRLFERCDHGELTLIILPAVLAECVFVLESFYTQPRLQIAAALTQLLDCPGVEIAEPAVHIDALDRYARSKLHFVDCVLAAAAATNHWPVATFDSGLKKLADVTVNVE